MKTMKQKLSEHANIPKDVSFGIPLLRMCGFQEITIENYRGILEYTDLLIRILTKEGQISIEGNILQIEHYSNEEMKVVGNIHALKFHQGG